MAYTNHGSGGNYTPGRGDQVPNMATRWGGGFGDNWYDQMMDPTGGWWKDPTWDMVNRYTGQRMSEGEFTNKYLGYSGSLRRTDMFGQE